MTVLSLTHSWSGSWKKLRSLSGGVMMSGSFSLSLSLWVACGAGWRGLWTGRRPRRRRRRCPKNQPFTSSPDLPFRPLPFNVRGCSGEEPPWKDGVWWTHYFTNSAHEHVAKHNSLKTCLTHLLSIEQFIMEPDWQERDTKKFAYDPFFPNSFSIARF